MSGLPAASRLFRNALCKDGRTRDLAVRAGRFVDPRALGENVEIIDLGGLLALPAFVEGHIHLDKSFVGDGWRPHRSANSLAERLTIEKRLLAEALPVRERADALLAQALHLGTIAMRSHVDIDPSLGLSHLHAVKAACEPWRGRVDVEIVAFPQAGILASPGTADLLDAAIREGASLVGGLDPTAFDRDADAHLDVVFGTAERHGVGIDIHLHEPGRQGIEQLRRIAYRTAAASMHGRVAVSHAYALGYVDRDEARRTADVLAEAGVSIMTNAPGNRALPPVALLRAAGVRVFAGNDNIRDAWWPYGDADMLARATMIGYRSGFFTDADLAIALDMATVDAAAVLGLERYGMEPGDDATFVIVDAVNPLGRRRRAVPRATSRPAWRDRRGTSFTAESCFLLPRHVRTLLMKTIALALALFIGAAATPACAADISTHVLDLARGVGGKGVPVTLSKRDADGKWRKVASATTDGDGRVRAFGDATSFDAGVYRLQFDMSGYPDASATPFFPEITLTFRVTDQAGHYHVPVVVSPFGYSTYRGN